MTDQQGSLPDPFEQAGDRSLQFDLRNLAQRATGYAQAELAFQKSRATHTANQAKSIAVLGVAAVLLVVFALFGLVVGLIIALAPILTPWGSTALVCVVLLIAAWLCARLASRRMRSVLSVFGDGEAE